VLPKQVPPTPSSMKVRPDKALDGLAIGATLSPPANVTNLFQSDVALKKLVKSLQPLVCAP
jgi:hypothetical protein